MTVKQLRDKLTSFIKSDRRNGDVQVWFNDDECNLLQIEEEEVKMVKPLDVLGKYGDIPIGETICCLNTHVDDEHGEMHIRGTEVVPSDIFERSKWQAQLVLEKIGKYMAEHAYFRSGMAEKMSQLKGSLFTDEVKGVLKVYREQFREAAKEIFETKGIRKLIRNFTREQIEVVRRTATELPPLDLELSGEELDPRRPKTMYANGAVITDYANT